MPATPVILAIGALRPTRPMRLGSAAVGPTNDPTRPQRPVMIVLPPAIEVGLETLFAPAKEATA
jgi:hypothetical protein